MKRIFFISMALFLVAGFFVSAYAEDRLSLSGEYRVRGFYTENFSNTDLTDGGYQPFDSDTKNDKNSYFDQRFRLGGKITAAEGVTANFRFDFGEEDWGKRESGGFDAPGNGRPTENAEFQVDRLYLRIERDIANFVAGQYDGAFGYTNSFETQAKWLLLRLKPGPVFIDLAYIKLDEGSGRSDEGDLDTEDDDLLGANVMYSAEKFGLGAFLGYRTMKDDETANPDRVAVRDDDLMGFGVYFNGSLGIVDLKAEVDIFSGEAKNDGAAAKLADLEGQQLYLFGNVKLSDMMAIPVTLLYAKGYATETDPTAQIVEMAPAFGDFYPYNLSTIWNGDYTPWPSGEAFSLAVDDEGDSTNGGVIALMAGFDFQAAEAHKVEFQIGYATPEDDIKYVAGTSEGRETMDSYLWGAAGWSWDFVPAAQFSAAFVYGAPSFDDPNQKDDAAYQLLTKIRVKFLDWRKKQLRAAALRC